MNANALSQFQVLLVGSTERGEFRDARAVIESLGQVVAVDDLDAASSAVRQGEVGGEACAPDLIVLVQAYPGQYSAAGLDRLRRSAPLARVVALLGSWSEGEVRSGKPLPGVTRVYWHQWPGRFAREVARLRRGQCPTWGLPITSTDEERLLAAIEPIEPTGHGRVAICARQAVMADMLQAACRAAGYSTLLLQPDQTLRAKGISVALVDGSDRHGNEAADIRALAAALGPVPILALLSFPRPHDCRRALDAGASAVLSKPLLLNDLYWQLNTFTLNREVRR